MGKYHCSPSDKQVRSFSLEKGAVQFVRELTKCCVQALERVR